MKRRILTMLVLALCLMVCLAQVGKAVPMGTAWTYQGRLMDANGPADGPYDFEFRLYADPNLNSSLVGDTIDINDLDVIDGYFTVVLDFGSDVFNGDARWLEIGVRPGDSEERCTILSPRQEVTPTPYSLYAANAGTDNDWIVSGNAMYSIPGRVGIGTTDPQTTSLFIQRPSAVSPLVVFQDGLVIKNGQRCVGNQLEIQNSSGNTQFVVTGTRVGIGTTTPQASLEVTSPVDTHGIRATSNYIPIHAVRTPPTGTWPAIQGDCNSLYNGASAIRGKILSTTPGSLSAGVYGYNSGEGSNGVGVRGHHVGSGTGVYGQCDNGFGGYFVGAKNYFGGNVGIGTTAPSGSLWPDSITLEIAGNAPSIVLDDGLGGSQDDFEISNGGDKALFRDATDGLDMLTIMLTGTNEGHVGIGTNSPTKKLTVRGNILVQSESTGASVAEIGEGLDYAEGFNVTENADIEAGTVLVIDSDNPGKLTVSRSVYDSKVAGIVAGAKGLGSGVRLGVGQFDYDVALAGRVYCNVDATKQAIQAGDLLTTSATAGYAMKATDYDRARGAILGKAMQKLEQGQKGQILVLVTLQ